MVLVMMMMIMMVLKRMIMMKEKKVVNIYLNLFIYSNNNNINSSSSSIIIVQYRMILVASGLGLSSVLHYYRGGSLFGTRFSAVNISLNNRRIEKVKAILISIKNCAKGNQCISVKSFEHFE